MIIQSVFPSLAKRVYPTLAAPKATWDYGKFYKEIIRKIPLNPPFPKWEALKKNFSSPFTKRGIQVHFS
jgi:hypothetical protein